MSEHLTNESELVELTAAELLPILTEHIANGETVGLEGPPGGGKSDLVSQAAKANGMHCFVQDRKSTRLNSSH